MSPAPYIDELRLTAFKSFRDQRLDLRDLTLVIGRNGSGKSNAIDALQVLAELATGDELRSAIDGSRTEASVRGGIRGCAPFGTKEFMLGCRVADGDRSYELDVTVKVEPDVQIISERLAVGDARSAWKPLLVTEDPDPDSGDITARCHDGEPGGDPAVTFRSNRLLLTQVPLRLPDGTPGAAQVIEGAQVVVRALQAVFVLDPVPSLMRQYVNERDTVLRRRAENLSAAVGALQADPETALRLREVVQALPEQPVDGIVVESSPLGDVVLALQERQGNRSVPVSARVMSDGMLRFVAFSAALLGAPLLEAATGAAARTMLVIEEVENGLHPSQAARIVELIRQESTRRELRTLATTHAPAVLSALTAEDHEGVTICDRDPRTGTSRLRRLVDLPQYPRALAEGTLGDAVVRRRLEGEPPDRPDALSVLDSVLGPG